MKPFEVFFLLDCLEQKIYGATKDSAISKATKNNVILKILSFIIRCGSVCDSTKIRENFCSFKL
jgi:hypothetical protein